MNGIVIGLLIVVFLQAIVGIALEDRINKLEKRVKDLAGGTK